MVWAVLKGILYHFQGSLDLCSKSDIAVELTKAAMMMMDLGDIKSAQRFLSVVQRQNRKKHACFCNIILRQYVEDVREMRGKSLKKLSDLSVFQPTKASIAAQNPPRQNHVTRLPGLLPSFQTVIATQNLYRLNILTDVLPSFPTVRFISFADASPTHAMKFLAALSPTVKAMSARSH